jgi:hypothetical protein
MSSYLCYLKSIRLFNHTVPPLTRRQKYRNIGVTRDRIAQYPCSDREGSISYKLPRTKRDTLIKYSVRQDTLREDVEEIDLQDLTLQRLRVGAYYYTIAQKVVFHQRLAASVFVGRESMLSRLSSV